MGIETLKGKVLTEVRNLGDEIEFIVSDDERYKLLHFQDCCESVYLEDVCGDLEDLVGTPILVAEESVSDDTPVWLKASESDESITWTFYKIDTNKGGVTLRWFGTSNGYYSESVSFIGLNDDGQYDPW